MNNSLQILARKAATLIGGYCLQQGWLTQSDDVKMENYIAAGIFFAVSFLWSHFHLQAFAEKVLLSSDPASSNATASGKNSATPLLVSAGLVLMLALGTVGTAHAQTNDPGNFFSSVKGYFTTSDTNSTTFAQAADLWIAENYRSGVNSSAELGASYDLWHVSTNLAVAPEVIIRHAGIAGVVVSEGAGVGLSYRRYDVKFTAYLNGGYSQFDSQGFIEVGLRAKKALTANTYAGIGIGLQKLFGASKAPGINTTSLTPTVTVFTGFTF